MDKAKLGHLLRFMGLGFVLVSFCLIPWSISFLATFGIAGIVLVTIGNIINAYYY